MLNSLAQAELYAEMQRMLGMLSRHLAARQDDCAPSAGPLRGIAIAEGEAEALLDELRAEFDAPAAALDDGAPLIADLQPDPDEPPLRRASRVFRLSRSDLDAVVLAIAVEIDHRFARLVAYLNDHIAQTRPTSGLLRALTGAALNAVEFSQRPMILQGLLLLGGDGPLPERPLRMAPDMLSRLG